MVSSTLTGVRILDLTRMLAGPFGTQILADMGADVIKIEDPEGGDPIREMGPPWLRGPDDEAASPYFLEINRNKKSVTLDPKSTDDRERFLHLVATADAVVDNFRPGVMARLGLDPPSLRRVKKDIITCSISAFGNTGPYRDLPAFDLILQAMGGGMSITGPLQGDPVRMGIPIGDLAGGMYLAIAVNGALFRRERTSEGQHVDLGLLDLQVSLLTYLAAYHWADGRVPGTSGTGHQTVVPYDMFEAGEGTRLVVAVFTDRFWPSFCEALELPELASAYRTNAERLAARDEVLSRLQARLSQRPAGHWLKALWERGVPAGPVNSIAEVLQDPQVEARGMVATTSSAHAAAGTYRCLGSPIDVGEGHAYRPAPLLGEHNNEILGDLSAVGSNRPVVTHGQ